MNIKILILACFIIVLVACQPPAPTGAVSPAEPPQPTSTSKPTSTFKPTSTIQPTSTSISPHPTVTNLVPAMPSKPAMELVYVTAFCTIIGKDAKTSVPSGTPISITWGWSATTDVLLNDFLKNNITEVTLDGKVIAGKRVEGVQKNRNSGEPEVVWVADVGILDPGQHVITYDQKFKKQISDGHATYGPGSKNETVHDQCYIVVEDNNQDPPQGKVTPQNSSRKTRPNDGMVMVYVLVSPFKLDSNANDVEKLVQKVMQGAFG